MVRRLLKLIPILSFLLCLSCRPGTPSGVLSEGDMEDVLYDYHVALALADNQRDAGEDQDANALRYLYAQKVFEKYGITQAQFDSSMVWYSAEGKRLQVIYAHLNERMDAEARTLGVGLSETEIYANYGMDGDTANVWSGRKLLYLGNSQPDNVTVLTIPTDTNFLPGDSYKLSFHANYLPVSRTHTIYVLFTAYYPDSSVVSMTQVVSGNYKVEMNLAPQARQDSLVADRLVVTLYAPPAHSSSEEKLFCMSFPSVLRIHAPKKPEVKAEVERADSLQQKADSLVADTVRNSQEEERLTPLEERDRREKRREIKIVKERVARPVTTGRRVVRRPSLQ